MEDLTCSSWQIMIILFTILPKFQVLLHNLAMAYSEVKLASKQAFITKQWDSKVTLHKITQLTQQSNHKFSSYAGGCTG